MRRQCGRPGCSSIATVTFSFDATRCVVWLDQIADGTPRAGDLCTRHADLLRPPQGWERVDRRPPRPAVTHGSTPASPAVATPDDLLPHATKRKPRKRPAEAPALFGDAPSEPVEPVEPVAPAAEAPKPEPAYVAAASTATPAAVATPSAARSETNKPSWLPRFANADDLDGVLDVSTPLLSRAFGQTMPADATEASDTTDDGKPQHS